MISGFVVGKKRMAEAADLGEMERRAVQLRQVTVGNGGDGNRILD